MHYVTDETLLHHYKSNVLSLLLMQPCFFSFRLEKYIYFPKVSFMLRAHKINAFHIGQKRVKNLRLIHLSATTNPREDNFKF